MYVMVRLGDCVGRAAVAPGPGWVGQHVPALTQRGKNRGRGAGVQSGPQFPTNETSGDSLLGGEDGAVPDSRPCSRGNR